MAAMTPYYLRNRAIIVHIKPYAIGTEINTNDRAPWCYGCDIWDYLERRFVKVIKSFYPPEHYALVERNDLISEDEYKMLKNGVTTTIAPIAERIASLRGIGGIWNDA